MSEKQKIRFDSKWIDLSDLFDCKTFDEVHADLESIRQKYRALVESDDLMRFDLRYSYDDTSLELDLFRWETDAELEKRLRLAEEQAQKRLKAAQLRKERADERARKQLMASEADERAEYERLRAKFEEAQ